LYGKLRYQEAEKFIIIIPVVFMGILKNEKEQKQDAPGKRNK
jgi:hypothetical protein